MSKKFVKYILMFGLIFIVLTGCSPKEKSTTSSSEQKSKTTEVKKSQKTNKATIKISE